MKNLNQRILRPGTAQERQPRIKRCFFLMRRRAGSQRFHTRGQVVSMRSAKHLSRDNTTVTGRLSAVGKAPGQESSEITSEKLESGVWAIAGVHTHTCTRAHARPCLKVFNKNLNLSAKRGAG